MRLFTEYCTPIDSNSHLSAFFMSFCDSSMRYVKLYNGIESNERSFARNKIRIFVGTKNSLFEKVASLVPFIKNYVKFVLINIHLMNSCWEFDSDLYFLSKNFVYLVRYSTDLSISYWNFLSISIESHAFTKIIPPTKMAVFNLFWMNIVSRLLSKLIMGLLEEPNDPFEVSLQPPFLKYYASTYIEVEKCIDMSWHTWIFVWKILETNKSAHWFCQERRGHGRIWIPQSRTWHGICIRSVYTI